MRHGSVFRNLPGLLWGNSSTGHEQASEGPIGDRACMALRGCRARVVVRDEPTRTPWARRLRNLVGGADLFLPADPGSTCGSGTRVIALGRIPAGFCQPLTWR